MKAAEVMTLDVATIRPDATVREAAQAMLHRGISGLPVVDAAGQLVGIVTEGDFLRRAETGTERRRPRWLEFLLGPGRLADEYVHSHGRKVEEVMTPDVITVSADTPLPEVVRTMERRRIKRVPVVSDGKIVGIISRANLVQALARLADEAPESHRDDEAIRTRILADLDKEPWAPGFSVNVIVRNGVAEFWGTIFDEREREAVRVVAENVPGIIGVRDHMLLVEPISGMVFESPDDAADAQKETQRQA
jgi:CBS domain-containing protein